MGITAQGLDTINGKKKNKFTTSPSSKRNSTDEVV